MGMLQARTKSILEASIRDFIETGKPVTSESLFDRYDFGIRPAMIRRELNFLGEAGFLSQNHPSAGRVPTDKAYRFFIRELLSRNGLIKKGNNRFADLIEEFLTGERVRFIKEMASYLKILSAGFEPETEWFVRSGFREMLEGLDFRSRDELLEVVNDLEVLPERLMRSVITWKEESNWPRVFVGKSPITKSPHLTVLVERLNPNKQELYLVAIGPKRMDYEKSLGLFKHLEKYV